MTADVAPDVLPAVDVPRLSVASRAVAWFTFPPDFDARACPGPIMVGADGEVVRTFDGTPARRLCGHGYSYPDGDVDFDATMHYLPWTRGESARHVTCGACGWAGMFLRPRWTWRTWVRLGVSHVDAFDVAPFASAAEVPWWRRAVGRVLHEGWVDGPWF